MSPVCFYLCKYYIYFVSLNCVKNWPKKLARSRAHVKLFFRILNYSMSFFDVIASHVPRRRSREGWRRIRANVKTGCERYKGSIKSGMEKKTRRMEAKPFDWLFERFVLGRLRRRVGIDYCLLNLYAGKGCSVTRLSKSSRGFSARRTRAFSCFHTRYLKKHSFLYQNFIKIKI